MYTRIKEIRESLNMSQADFSKRVGLSQSTLAMMEIGKRTFAEKHKKLLCSEFNINKSWLDTGFGEMFNSSPLESELMSIFNGLAIETKEHLIHTAKNLLKTQNELLEKNQQKKDE